MSTGGGRILRRLAVLVCPPELMERDLTGRLTAEFEAQLAHLPALARHALVPALRLFDQGARLRHGGRRFVRLDDARADAYLSWVLYHRAGPLSTVVRLVRGLLVMAFYELPEVKAGLGYDPAGYVARVSARRLASYGAEIRAAEIRTAEAER